MGRNIIDISTNKSNPITLVDQSKKVVVTNNVSNNSVTIDLLENNVNLQKEISTVVEVGILGPRGPQGETGAQGPIGPAGNIDLFSSLAISGSLIVSGAGHITASGGISASGDITGKNATFDQIRNEGLNVGRVTFAGTNGILIDDDNFTFISNILSTPNIIVSSGITGSLLGTSSFASTASFVATSSFATTSSFALNVPTGTGFPFTGSAGVSGSLNVVGPISGTLITAAQTNITSVGTLDSLTLGGDIDMDGNTINTNGGEIQGAAAVESLVFKAAADQDLTIQADGNITFKIDDDNDETGQSFKFQNNNTEIANLDESGNLQLDGSITSSGNISASGNVIGNEFIGTASHAETSSFTTTASFALNVLGTEGFPFTGSAEISGSLSVNGPLGTILASGSVIGDTGSFTYIKTTGDVSASGDISASGFFGDGSGLTGTSGNPFPFTGSAKISGSLEVTEEISASVFNLIGEITSASVVEGNDELILSSSEVVKVQSPVLNLSSSNGITTGSVSNAKNGFIIYDNVNHGFYGYANGNWVRFHS